MLYNGEESLEILSRTPTILIQLLEGLPDGWIKNNEGPNTWSPYEVVGHLIHGEKTDWIPRAQIILSNSKNKDFEPFDRFAQSQEDQNKPIESLLEEFRQLREANLRILKSLDLNESQLQKIGVHPEFGVVTLKQLLSTWVVHDLGHISQIVRVMAKQYTDEVGPWVDYLGILKQ
ncbi:DinB family protein [Flagellimonas sp.]|uniref:DinB family protein n=1 Tax=Flagellimonas sp. TaxID=2058762 RepID=UPI003F49C0C3